MENYEAIKNLLENAQSIVITAGAGMSVDSGLADYRGDEGQWGAVESNSGKSIFEVVNPQAFLDNPTYSWTLFAERMKKYATTKPHNGYHIVKKWIEKYHLDYFVLTSNIDGHFKKAGFDENKIRELHGSLTYFQSAKPNLLSITWKNELSADDILKNISKNIFPTCPSSDVPARPNVYMFRDDTYIQTQTKEQERMFQTFLDNNKDGNMIVLEIGSGPHVQTVRMKTRMLKTDFNAHIIRINPKDFKVKFPHIGIAKGALEALTEIDAFLNA